MNIIYDTMKTKNKLGIVFLACLVAIGTSTIVFADFGEWTRIDLIRLYEFENISHEKGEEVATHVVYEHDTHTEAEDAVVNITTERLLTNFIVTLDGDEAESTTEAEDRTRISWFVYYIEDGVAVDDDIVIQEEPSTDWMEELDHWVAVFGLYHDVYDRFGGEGLTEDREVLIQGDYEYLA